VKRNKTLQKLSRDQIRASQKLSAESILQFQDDFQKMNQGLDEPAKMISIRIPANILRSLKLMAQTQNRGYQSLMIELVRSGLNKYNL